MKKNTSIILTLAVGVIAGGIGMYFISGYLTPAKPVSVYDDANETAAVTKEKKVLYWQAPMDPTFIRDEPGKSPMGMDLIPVYEGHGDGEETEPGTVKIDPITIQTIGVRTATVERKRLKKAVRTVGRIDYDEKRVYHVHTKVDGWIEKLYVDSTGQKVKKDDYLLELYSPTLVSAQEEYLLARRYREKMAEVGRGSIAELSRRRLELWDVPAHQIRELEEKGKVMRTLHIHSPATGIVIKKPATEGMYVKPGTRLYTIADISRVWVYVDVYEYELPWIKVGQEADMTLASYPGRTFRGRVSFIYPFMEPETRTNKVRIEFKNPGGKLKPDMYANVTLKSVISRDAVAVPTEAVIRSGERNMVIVSKGEGRFAPREVTLGSEAEGYYAVLEGLDEGDIVVTSAQFLIDSESRLKEAIGKMLDKKSEEMEHSGMEEMDPGSEKDMDMEEMDHQGMEEMDDEPMQHKH